MFRCCLPCRGGSKDPATSRPNTPTTVTDPKRPPQLVSVLEGVSATPLTTALPAAPTQVNATAQESGKSVDLGDFLQEQDENESVILVPPSVVQRLCQSVSTNQQSLLPHIVEEEEVNLQINSDELATQNSSSSTTNSSERDLCSKVLDHRFVVPLEDFSSPSPPRTKHSGHWGKHTTKGRTRSVTSTNSSDTITSGPGGTKSDIINPNTSSSSQQPTSCLLLPKMQAEQGSIGDLQKYHSRYLKNRRHTLANVR